MDELKGLLRPVSKNTENFSQNTWLFAREKLSAFLKGQ
jgi:hypothetical protein